MDIPLLVRRCLEKFKALSISETQHAERILDESGRFRIWAGNVSAHTSGRRSLQHRLRDSSELSKAVTNHLNNLLRHLNDVSSPASDDEESDNEASDDEVFDDVASEDSTDETSDEDDRDLFEMGDSISHDVQALEMIGEIINCLMRISMALRNPARNDQIRYAETALSKLFEPRDIEHVRMKFPSTSDGLTQRLGKSISRHRQYFKYRKEHHEKLAHGIDMDADDEGEKQSTAATSLFQPEQIHQQPHQGIATYDESDLESVGTATSYAPSQTGDSTLRPPSRPLTATDDLPFECSICYHFINAPNERLWRQHVYEDLPPYICLYEDCKAATRQFSRRRDWRNHMQEHFRYWICPFECRDTFETSAEHQDHLRSVHSERLDQTTMISLSESCARSNKTPLLRCPFCELEKPSQNAWFKHVGHHLEQLALFALPKHLLAHDSDDDDDERLSDSDVEPVSEEAIILGQEPEPESDRTAQTIEKPATVSELIAFVKSALDADVDRQESQMGSTLDLSHRKLSTLPLELIPLIKDRVERLALSHNPRITLPIEIGQCDRLRYLNLRWNNLKHFPDAVLSLDKLEILDISKNSIEIIPESIKQMTNLKFLAIARNRIKRLPYALGDMNLLKLKIDENPIEFPPPEALKETTRWTSVLVESERDRDICNRVKHYMKTGGRREIRGFDESVPLSNRTELIGNDLVAAEDSQALKVSKLEMDLNQEEEPTDTISAKADLTSELPPVENDTERTILNDEFDLSLTAGSRDGTAETLQRDFDWQQRVLRQLSLNQERLESTPGSSKKVPEDIIISDSEAEPENGMPPSIDEELPANPTEGNDDPVLDSLEGNIYLKDGIGRVHSFPIHACRTMADMDALIEHAFSHVGTHYRYVVHRHYNLRDPSGEIITPQTWPQVVHPGLEVTMEFWAALRESPNGKETDAALLEFGNNYDTRWTRFPRGDLKVIEPEFEWIKDLGDLHAGSSSKTPRNVSPVDQNRGLKPEHLDMESLFSKSRDDDNNISLGEISPSRDDDFPPSDDEVYKLSDHAKYSDEQLKQSDSRRVGHPLSPSYADNLPDEAVLASPEQDSTSQDVATSSESPTIPGTDEGHYRDHPLYSEGPHADGLYRCPFSTDPSCSHKATTSKSSYDKFIDFHLKPFRCKVETCSQQAFSSTAAILRHEREAHGMHSERPHLCPYPGCERGLSGNGFPRRYNLYDHIRRVHVKDESSTRDIYGASPEDVERVPLAKHLVTESESKEVESVTQISSTESASSRIEPDQTLGEGQPESSLQASKPISASPAATSFVGNTGRAIEDSDLAPGQSLFGKDVRQAISNDVPSPLLKIEGRDGIAQTRQEEFDWQQSTLQHLAKNSEELESTGSYQRREANFTARGWPNPFGIDETMPNLFETEEKMPNPFEIEETLPNADLVPEIEYPKSLGLHGAGDKFASYADWIKVNNAMDAQGSLAPDSDRPREEKSQTRALYTPEVRADVMAHRNAADIANGPAAETILSTAPRISHTSGVSDGEQQNLELEESASVLDIAIDYAAWNSRRRDQQQDALQVPTVARGRVRAKQASSPSVRNLPSTRSPAKSPHLPASVPEQSDTELTASRKASTKNPATFQCTYCSKRFTRAYNLRSHLRTHTDERPYVCTVCGKSFARQHDRKLHEGLHSEEKKYVCRGTLQSSGSQWGCGRRFARPDALGRHFRSEAGRVCIEPLLHEANADRKGGQEEPPAETTTQLKPNVSDGLFPTALLRQYPALAGIDSNNPHPRRPLPDEGYDGDSGGEHATDDESVMFRRTELS